MISEEISLLDEMTAYETQAEQNKVDKLAEFEKLLETNDDLRKQYKNISTALNTLSDHLGENALSIILKRIDEIGDEKVDPIQLLKILFMESTGRFYSNKETGTVLKSNSGAYGAFQVTKDTQDYLNRYFKLKGTKNEINIMNPYGNIDAGIYMLRFLSEKRGEDLAKGKVLPTGDSLEHAMVWSYHDGAWANKITNNGSNYLRKYNNLAILSEYPEFIDYYASKN